jgi:hypothetical protein
MKYRCLNKGSRLYPKYGGKGITIVSRWIDSFENFLADMGERPAGTTLDRYPDNNGDYEPGNCRWATPKQQNRNRNFVRRITAFGKTMTIDEWAEETGLSSSCLRKRVIDRNWTPEKALTKPISKAGGSNRRYQ